MKTLCTEVATGGFESLPFLSSEELMAKKKSDLP
jgi:hypothetical protein